MKNNKEGVLQTERQLERVRGGNPVRIRLLNELTV